MTRRRPFRFRRARAALAAASLLAVGACSDATGPLADVVGGTYVLTEINGQALPYRLYGDATGPRSEIVFETIAFHRFGRAERTRTLRTVDAAGAVETIVLRRETHYRPVEASPTSAPGAPLLVGAFHPCPPPSPTALSVACDPDEHGVAAGETLQLSTVVYGAMSATPLALHFRRGGVVVLTREGPTR